MKSNFFFYSVKLHASKPEEKHLKALEHVWKTSTQKHSVYLWLLLPHPALPLEGLIFNFACSFPL